MPFERLELNPGLGEHEHRLLLLRFSGFDLLGCYFPQGEAKRPVFEYISSHIVQRLSKFGVVIGDLNTGRHLIDEKGKSFACADFFEVLQACGLTDSWRKRNPDTLEYSWFSSAGNGFRIDHAFCTSHLDRLVTSAKYFHHTRVEGVSDHSALVLEFDDL